MGLIEITPSFTGRLVCSDREYHAAAAIGSTSLRTLINKSPAHYLYAKTNPSEPTPSQKLGQAIHQAILEPKRELLVTPVFEGRTKKGELTTSMNCEEVKEKSIRWHMENHGKTIVKQEELVMINGIRAAILNHKKAVKLVAGGSAEESFFWKDVETGIHMKVRPDFLRDDHIIVDVKSSMDASTGSFQKDVASFGYHIQAAMYLDGVGEVLGRTYDKFLILAVEKEPPYDVVVHELTENAIREGRALYQQGLKKLKTCMDSGSYPGYSQEIVPLDLPAWAYKTEYL